MNRPTHCPGPLPSRREIVRLGALGTLGLTLPQLFAGRARAQSVRSLGADPASILAATRGRAKSCVLLFMLGGPAHQDTWDMKPDAPAENRGVFQSINTSAAGIRVCEHMPHLARQAHRYALIRSVTHADNNHSTSGYTMMTGRPSPRPLEGALPSPTDYPNMGSVLAKYLPKRSPLPPYVILPDRAYNDGGITWPGQFGGFLGKKYDPFILTGDPTKPKFSVDSLTLSSDMAGKRFDGRRKLLDDMNRNWKMPNGPASDGAVGASYDRAMALLASPSVRKAFDLSQEPEKLRRDYLVNKFGQGCLMARRLVEAEVPLITVNWNRAVDTAPHWDTHKDNFNALKNALLPSVDQAVATFLDDLDSRGLLDTTLVVWISEFGRTPKINGAAGRDHYGRCNSIFFAGAGVRGGQVIGSSDRIAAMPKDNPIHPNDVCSTIYNTLGLDPRSEMRDAFDRPLPISEGRLIHELWS